VIPGGPLGPLDPLEGLDPTPEERLAFYEALDEVEAEEAAGLYGDDDDGAGPWHDQLHAIGESLDDAYATSAAVAAEDDEDAQWLATRPNDVDKMARAISRIEAGTYTPPGFFRPPRDIGGGLALSCGEALDAFGRCASRYHQAGCSAVVASAAATGSATEAQAWRDTLNARQIDPDVLGLQLATPAIPEPGTGTDMWADLLETGEPSSHQEIYAQVLAGMGEPGPPPPQVRGSGPDVRWLREALGL